jgi:hypothetical protein
MNEKRIPAGFYYDHVDRDLAAPPIIKVVGKSVVIDTDHEDFAELIEDAQHYAEDTAGWHEDAKRYVYMARRLLMVVS